MYLLSVLTQRNVYLLDRTFYYLSDECVEEGVRVNITFNEQKIVGYVVKSTKKEGSKEAIEKELGIKLNYIDEIIDQKPILSKTLMNLAKELQKRYVYPLIGVLQTMLPPSLKPKSTYQNAAKIKKVKYYCLADVKINEQSFTKNELKILEKFKGRKYLEKKELNTTKSLENLLNKGIIFEKEEEKYRYRVTRLFENYEKEITLSEKQNAVYEEIVKNFGDVFLIHGVTGSGKTEVYIKLIEKVRQEGKGAIVLVPEIALTPLMISRLYTYFDDEIAVLHSSLTSAEIYDEYRRISEGKAEIVIGTRSAIFAPVNNLGLIVIDEENDECYKQDDQGLLYNAKDVALLRNKLEKVTVVFGSATPSIETMAKAKNGVFKLLKIDERYSKIDLPDVYLIDSTNYKNYPSLSSIYSLELIKDLKEVISKNKQAILFINRRGYANYLQCRECGHVFKCPHCGLPLHFHKESNILYCHHCEYKIKKPTRCDKCGSSFLSYGQFGVEKAVEDFKKLFPNVPFLVLDSDHAKKTFEIESVLNSFNNGEANVLIGTQIVAKGHDFENVSLVGVLNADTLLNFPNYRSNEMTFSLLTQVIGRAGRKLEKGKAIVQTSNSSFYAIQTAIKQDYESFYNNEIKYRKALNNPPFNSILAIEVSSQNANYLEEYTNRVRDYFVSLGIKEIEIIGPSILRRNKFKCWKYIFIKYKRLADVIEDIESLIDIYKSESKVRLKLNFNPYAF